MISLLGDLSVIRTWLIAVLFAGSSCLLLTACLGGSMPNLDKPECAQSRDVVKQFYSIHFGGEMAFSAENLQTKKKFLTPEFFSELEKITATADIFTTDSDDVPRAFRLGGCEVVGPDKTRIEVLLFWKNGDESRQKSIKAEVLRNSGSWLINKILK